MKGFSTLLVASEQVTPWLVEAVDVGDATRDIMVVVAPGQEQVRGRQHGDGDAGIGETPAPILKVREAAWQRAW